MLLAIDVGNTNVVVGLLEGRQLLKTWRISTHPLITADEFRVKLQMFFSFENIPWKSWDACAVSSVVPAMTAILRTVFEDSKFVVIDHKSPFSFENRANPPEQVGADRLVNAEAGYRELGAPLIIVDSGTATTLCALKKDPVTGQASYLGGAILPGIELSSRALATNTAKLFTVELVPPQNVIGSNTQEAIRSGLILGYASMIDGMIQKFRSALGSPEPRVLATGGVIRLLEGLTIEKMVFDPDLTLKGIGYVFESIRSR